MYFQNGVILGLPGGPPLPLDLTPNANTAGAATWVLRLTQTKTGFLELQVLGQGAPAHQVNWTVRIAATVSPNLQQ